MSVRKALTFAFVDRYASLIVTLGASMVLARLLTPADVAVFSIATVLLGFLASVRDLGAGQYLVRERELDGDRIRAVWTVQLGLGIVLAVAVALASAPVAALYREPRMRDIMLVLALSYLINPFGSITHAWLTRELRYEAIALVRFCSTLAGSGVSVALAWQGFGPMSLALGSLASTAVTAVLLLPLRPRSFPWLPGWRHVDRVASFGGALTAADLAWTLAKGAPELLLGRLQSLTAAGLYSRASGLVALFNKLVTDTIHGVALSWFAREARLGGDIAPSFVKATACVTAVGWTFCGVIVFLARPIIELLFGPQWTGAAELASLLAVAMALGVPVALCFAALVAAGAVAQVLKATVASAVVLVALSVPAAWFGLFYTGWAHVAAAAFDAALFLWLTHKVIPFPWAELRGALSKSAGVAACAAIGPAAAWAGFAGRPEAIVAPVLAGVVGCAVGFLAAIWLFRHPIQQELLLLWGKAHALRSA
jgi:O-antigen/teichoic acid export membrane protein